MKLKMMAFAGVAMVAALPVLAQSRDPRMMRDPPTQERYDGSHTRSGQQKDKEEHMTTQQLNQRELDQAKTAPVAGATDAAMRQGGPPPMEQNVRPMPPGAGARPIESMPMAPQSAPSAGTSTGQPMPGQMQQPMRQPTAPR